MLIAKNRAREREKEKKEDERTSGKTRFSTPAHMATQADRQASTLVLWVLDQPVKLNYIGRGLALSLSLSLSLALWEAKKRSQESARTKTTALVGHGLDGELLNGLLES